MRKQKQQEETIYGYHRSASVAIYSSLLPLMDELPIFPPIAFCNGLCSLLFPQGVMAYSPQHQRCCDNFLMSISHSTVAL